MVRFSFKRHLTVPDSVGGWVVSGGPELGGVYTESVLGSGSVTAARGREFIHTVNGSCVCIREAKSDWSKIKQVWALACLIITPI